MLVKDGGDLVDMGYCTFILKSLEMQFLGYDCGNGGLGTCLTLLGHYAKSKVTRLVRYCDC